MLTQNQMEQLAQQFLGNAVKAKDGESIWIEYQGGGRHLAEECCAYIKSVGGNPFVVDAGASALRALFDAAQQSGDRDAYFQSEGQKLLEKMKTMQGYIRICDRHDTEKANFNPDDMMDYRRLMMKGVTDHRVQTYAVVSC